MLIDIKDSLPKPWIESWILMYEINAEHGGGNFVHPWKIPETPLFKEDKKSQGGE